MNCRHCGQPVREIPSAPPNIGTHWVHTDTDQYPCLDSDGTQTLDLAEPGRGYPFDEIAAARDAYEGAVALMEETRDRRDGYIREALQRQVSPAAIADASGLKVARIYQIRDGRR